MKLSRRSRWTVPASAVVVTGALLAGVPALASSVRSAPSLPYRSPAQLLAKIAGNRDIPPMQGTITETVSLGLPKLPDVANQDSITSMLTGSHTFGYWYAGPRHLRISMPGPMRESDLYVDGSTAWLWQSVSDSAEKFTSAHSSATAPPRSPAALPVSPLQAANIALAFAAKSTKVTTGPTEWVAGQSAYTLQIAPKDSRSLIGKILIAVDSANGVPLQVQVFARGAGSPAMSIGFTQLSFTAPSAGDLSFTPPPGAHVSVGSSMSRATGGDTISGGNATGSGWLTVFELPASALRSLSHAQPQQSGQGLQGASSAEGQAAFGALLNDGTPVHGAWGSGSLIKTSLLSVLIANNGEVYIGAVVPSVLYAAVK
jgi:hypothetical protein